MEDTFYIEHSKFLQDHQQQTSFYHRETNKPLELRTSLFFYRLILVLLTGGQFHQQLIPSQFYHHLVSIFYFYFNKLPLNS